MRDVFVKRLKEERANYKLTQQKVAQMLGISLSAYRSYESLGQVRHRDPDLETLVRIADILEVSLDYLLGRVDR